MFMKKIVWCTLGALLSVGLAFSAASAGNIVLFELAFNANGIVTDYLPYTGVTAPATGSLNAEGLGTLTWTTKTPGNRTFIAFFDHEIDETVNGFANEYGTAHGSPAAGQSWQIDEPGYVFGNIFSNVKNGTLNNTNSVPSSQPDDVSMALGWNFHLNVGDSATITLNLSRDVPAAGFYLSQTDPDSPDTFYFSSSLEVKVAPAPLPGTLFLLGSGLAGLWFGGRKRFL